jgi:PAS domain S-box-containing protein
MTGITRNRLILIIIVAALTMGSVITTIFSLKSGIFEVFPYLYILPIIIIAYISPRHGVYFTVVVGWIYLGLVYIYGPFDIKLYAASSAWFYIIVSLGVVLSAFSNEVAKERKYRDIFLNSQSGIFTFDLDTHKIQEFNMRIASILGYGPGGLKDVAVSTLWHKDQELESFISRLKNEQQISDTEVAFKRKDGGTVWAQVTAALSADQAVICSAADITERRRAEAAIQDSEKRYRMIGELIPFGVWMCDAKGEFTYLSDSFLQLIGMTLEECRKGGWLKRLAPEDIGRTQNDWKQCVATGCFWDYEYRIFDKKGNDHFVLSRGAPLRNETGRIVSWVGNHLDITERRRYENRLEASLKEKEVIIKEVHHRVKNNMQVISGFLHLQSNYIKDPDSVEKLNECQRRVKTMALVHEKLYQSKHLGFINSEEYVKSLVSDLVESYALRTDIDIQVNVESVNINLDIAIPCGLIINELLTNALKYAFKDRLSGHITVDMRLGQDHRFTLVVSDDGAGLPAGFDIGSTATLGMQLVAVLVRQLGGEIRIKSGDGTTFTISFPEKF